MKSIQPLSLNFHQTFIPDRNLIAKLMQFVAQGGQGRKEVISEATGIPTGKSSGKVEPTIYYAMAMGLIDAKKSNEVWNLALTPLGLLVHEEDPYLAENVTQWLMHLMICRRHGQEEPARGLADSWFALFADRGFRLKESFHLADYLSLLQERHPDAPSLSKHASIVLRSYEEEVSLFKTGALTSRGNGEYQFQAAPKDRSFYPLYAAYFLILWDEHYPTRQQVQLSELFDTSRLLTLFSWSQSDASHWLDWLSDHRVIQLDKQTGDALVTRLQTTQTSHQAIQEIYSELL